jgi:hypothetical protein
MARGLANLVDLEIISQEEKKTIESLREKLAENSKKVLNNKILHKETTSKILDLNKDSLNIPVEIGLYCETCNIYSNPDGSFGEKPHIGYSNRYCSPECNTLNLEKYE